MNEKQLVLGDTAVKNAEFEVNSRPPYLLDQIYPDLVAKHPDVIEVIEPLLATYASYIRQKGYSFDAVRSGFHRLIAPNPLTDQVKSEFAYVHEHFGLEDEIWTELARGSDDFDCYVGKIIIGEHEPVKFGQEELDTLGKDFLDIAEMTLPNILSQRFKFIVDPRHVDEKSQQEVIEYLTYIDDGSGNSSDKYGIKIKFGQHEGKPDVTVGKIQVVDLTTGREIFVIDSGFYTNYQKNRRYGLLVDEASQLGATLVATPNMILRLDPKYTEAELDEKRGQLIGPDTWKTTAFDKNVPADAEKIHKRNVAKKHKNFQDSNGDNNANGITLDG